LDYYFINNTRPEILKISQAILLVGEQKVNIHNKSPLDAQQVAKYSDRREMNGIVSITSL